MMSPEVDDTTRKRRAGRIAQAQGGISGVFLCGLSCVCQSLQLETCYPVIKAVIKARRDPLTS